MTDQITITSTAMWAVTRSRVLDTQLFLNESPYERVNQQRRQTDKLIAQCALTNGEFCISLSLGGPAARRPNGPSLEGGVVSFKDKMTALVINSPHTSQL